MAQHQTVLAKIFDIVHRISPENIDNSTTVFIIMKAMAVTHPMQTFRKIMILIIRRKRLKQMTMKKLQKKKMILTTTLKTTHSLLE